MDLALGTFLIGIGLALTLGSPPNWLPNIPPVVAHMCVGLGFGLMAQGVLLLSAAFSDEKSSRVYKRIISFRHAELFPWFSVVVVVFPAIIGVVVIANPSDEDLRASFHVTRSAAMEFDFDARFLNVGKQSTLIDYMGLFQIITKYKGDEPSAYMNLCDHPYTAILTVRTFFPTINMGNDALQMHFYDPSELSIDEKNWKIGDPIAVEATKTSIISAKFKIIQVDYKKFDTVVMCPAIFVSDKVGERHLAICKAYMVAVTKTGFTSGRTEASFQILPRSSETVCSSVR